MARKLRVEYPGAIYHVMNRGDRCEAIFRGDSDRELFLKTLGEVCLKTNWQVHAYCLMGNHFHLVLETPQANLVGGMKWLLGTYTSRFNRRHKLSGHLFGGRYKVLIVDGGSSGYLKTVCDYVHLNPARAKLLAAGQSLCAYRWSSWPAYLQAPSKRPGWLRVDRLFGEYRIPKDSRAGRREIERLLGERQESEEVGVYREIRRGWYFGEEAFRKELLGQMEQRMGPHHYGAERLESIEEKGCRVLRDELSRRRWEEKDLLQRRKGDPEKVLIAQRLRAETLLTVRWIAKRLHMGSLSHLSNRLSLLRKRHSETGQEPEQKRKGS